MITIIAEAGSSPAPAWDFMAWAEAAKRAGADAVKYQCFRADHFPEAERESKYPLEFPRHRMDAMRLAAHYYGLKAGVSVFDETAAIQAARDCDFVKLAAREQTNWGLFKAAYEATGEYGKPLYRSVSDLNEVNTLPGIVHLCAIQQYPAPLALSCLQVLKTARVFRSYNFQLQGTRWGWSSHTTGTFDVLLACRLGASVVEKHISITPSDCEAPHSLLPAQFAAMCRAIRKNERN